MKKVTGFFDPNCGLPLSVLLFFGPHRIFLGQAHCKVQHGQRRALLLTPYGC